MRPSPSSRPAMTDAFPQRLVIQPSRPPHSPPHILGPLRIYPVPHRVPRGLLPHRRACSLELLLLYSPDEMHVTRLSRLSYSPRSPSPPACSSASAPPRAPSSRAVPRSCSARGNRALSRSSLKCSAPFILTSVANNRTGLSTPVLCMYRRRRLRNKIRWAD